MPRPVLSCPMCNSDQPFPLRQRLHRNSNVVIEVFISCTICPYQRTVRLSTKRLEALRVDKHRAEIARKRRIERYGSPSASINGAIKQYIDEIRIEEAKLP